jgi:hypothetical protein
LILTKNVEHIARKYQLEAVDVTLEETEPYAALPSISDYFVCVNAHGKGSIEILSISACASQVKFFYQP